MRCTFKTVFYVNGSKERNGIVPIMGRVTINGTIAQFSCKQSVTKAIWDAKGNRAIGKSNEAKEVNFALDNIKAQIAKHYQRLSDREAFGTAEMVRNAYQGIGTEYETLLRAFDKENAAFAKRVGKDRAKNTYNKYLVVRKYVAEFIKYQYKRSDMSMNELTEEFIRDYCLYLKNVVVSLTFLLVFQRKVSGDACKPLAKPMSILQVFQRNKRKYKSILDKVVNDSLVLFKNIDAYPFHLRIIYLV